MASRLAGYVAIQGCAAQHANVMQASKLAAQNVKVIYNQILEKNKHRIRDRTGSQTHTRTLLRHAGSLLAKQLFYTRLASIPGSYESFWKELDGIKGFRKGRKQLLT